MSLICIVTDKNGKILSDDELSNKTIDSKDYYDCVLPIRERVSKKFQQKKNI